MENDSVTLVPGILGLARATPSSRTGMKQPAARLAPPCILPCVSFRLCRPPWGQLGMNQDRVHVLVLLTPSRSALRETPSLPLKSLMSITSLYLQLSDYHSLLVEYSFHLVEDAFRLIESLDDSEELRQHAHQTITACEDRVSSVCKLSSRLPGLICYEFR